MKIAVSGPGRSGSTLLVRILSKWGFSAPETPYFRKVEGGLEWRLGRESPFELHKDPWAFEYIHSVDLSYYDWFIIPVRDRLQATVSRSVQERFSRAVNRPDDYWKWRTGGWAAGGAVVDTSVGAISQAVSEGLWDLIHEVIRQEIQPVFLDFPRFAVDFNYLWAQTEEIVKGRISESDAYSAWMQVVDTNKIRIKPEIDREDWLHPDEPYKIIEMLRAEIAELKGAKHQD